MFLLIDHFHIQPGRSQSLEEPLRHNATSFAFKLVCTAHRLLIFVAPAYVALITGALAGRVTFPGPDGVTLTGYVFTPKNAGRHPAVV